MLPDGGGLSTQPIIAPFVGARGLPVSDTVDYEDGGLALNDTSRGHLYQVWRGRIIGDDVVLDAPEVTETVIYSAPGISRISFTFDQNMRPTLAFVRDGAPYLRWYDPSEQGVVITPLGAIATPCVTLDDKRPNQTRVSDIVLAYKRAGGLFYRLQRDRFQVEYDPLVGLTPEIRQQYQLQISTAGGLVKIGMNRQWRLQFMLEATPHGSFG